MVHLFNSFLAGIAHGLALPTAWWAFSAWRNTAKLRAIYDAQRAASANLHGLARMQRP